jgi:hypothetical protein
MYTTIVIIQKSYDGEKVWSSIIDSILTGAMVQNRHILKDWGPSTTASPACSAMRKIFCTGPTKAAKEGQKSLVPTRPAQQTNISCSLSGLNCQAEKVTLTIEKTRNEISLRNTARKTIFHGRTHYKDTEP